MKQRSAFDQLVCDVLWIRLSEDTEIFCTRAITCQLQELAILEKKNATLELEKTGQSLRAHTVLPAPFPATT